MRTSPIRTTLLYFTPIFLILLLFALGIFWYLHDRIATMDSLLKEVSHTIAFENRSDTGGTNGQPDESLVQIEDSTRSEVEALISTDDWYNLSMEEIDARLVAHGIAPIGNKKNPQYTVSQKTIASVIKDAEWYTLSPKEIDDRLRSAGIHTIGNPADPTYALRPSEIRSEYLHLSSVTATALENFQNTLNLNLLWSIFGGLLLVLVTLFILSYFYSLRSLRPLELALAKQRQFVADASHEIRTPLSLMQMGAELLLRNKKADTRAYEKFTRNTLTDVEYLSGLTTYLLKGARLENGQYTPKKETIHMRDFSDQIVETFLPRASEKGIHLSTDIASDITMLTDPYLMREILESLIDNAIKYTDRGSITLRAESHGKMIRYTLHDTGVGIGKEHLSHIFERFYRVSGDRHEKSYGLGLSLVKQSIDHLHGHISVESEEGVGTVFMIEIPIT